MCLRTYVYYLFVLMCSVMHAQENDANVSLEKQTVSDQKEQRSVVSDPSSIDKINDQAVVEQPDVIQNELSALEVTSQKKQEVPSSGSITHVPQPPLPSIAAPTVPTSKPADVQQRPTTTVEDEEDDDLLKIDTIDLSEPKGNWLLKRRWWEKAQRTYEKIKQQVESIFESRMFFYNQRADLDRNVFASFYQQVGIGEGELQVIVSELIARLEQEDKEQSPEVKRYVQLLKSEKEKLQTLQKKIDLVVEYDRSLNDALIKLREQINVARNYEQQAWNNFKQIAVELSDKRAHELFYVIKGLSKNIADIYTWITNPYNDYFIKLLKAVKQEVAQVTSMLQELKEKGIDVKQDIDEFLAQQEQEQEAQGEEESQEPTVMQRVVSTISWPFVAAWNGIKSIFSSIAGFFGRVEEEDENELAELDQDNEQ